MPRRDSATHYRIGRTDDDGSFLLRAAANSPLAAQRFATLRQLLQAGRAKLRLAAAGPEPASGSLLGDTAIRDRLVALFAAQEDALPEYGFVEIP